MTKRIKCPNCGSSNMCNVYDQVDYEYFDPMLEEYRHETYENEFMYSLCEDCAAEYIDKIETMVVDDGAEAP